MTGSVPLLVPGKDRPGLVLDWKSIWPPCRKALLRLRASLPLGFQIGKNMVLGGVTMGNCHELRFLYSGDKDAHLWMRIL